MYNAGTEHVRFSRGQADIAGTKRKAERRVLSGSHEGVSCTRVPKSVCEMDFGTVCVLSCIWMTASNSFAAGGKGVV